MQLSLCWPEIVIAVGCTGGCFCWLHTVSSAYAAAEPPQIKNCATAALLHHGPCQPAEPACKPDIGPARHVGGTQVEAPPCSHHEVPGVCQAESDHHVRDTLNYMTVQTDVAMPSRALEQVQDPARVQPWRDAMRWAVGRVRAEDKDVRVLNLGASAGAAAACPACRCEVEGGVCARRLGAGCDTGY